MDAEGLTRCGLRLCYMRHWGPDGVLNCSGQLWHHPAPEGIKWGMVCQRLFLSNLTRALQRYKLHSTLGLAQMSPRQSGFGVLVTLEVPSGAFTHSACHQGCTASTSLQVTPGHSFLCRSSRTLVMTTAIMLTAHRASNAWWELALWVLLLIQSPRCLLSHAWKHTILVACLAIYLPPDRTYRADPCLLSGGKTQTTSTGHADPIFASCVCLCRARLNIRGMQMAPWQDVSRAQMVQLSLSQGVMAWLQWLSPQLDLLLPAAPGLVTSC